MKTSKLVNNSVSIQITKCPPGKERIRKSVLATFVAALGPLSFGFSLSFSSPVLVDLEESTSEIPSLRLTSEEASWFSVRNQHFITQFCEANSKLATFISGSAKSHIC